MNSVVPCERMQDSLGFWIPRCGFRIPGTGFQYLSVEIEFLIAIISGIPDSLSCIPDSKNQESGFHKQNHIQDSWFRILFMGRILEVVANSRHWEIHGEFMVSSLQLTAQSGS